MKLLELFDSQDKKNRLSHIKNLVALASSDGDFDEIEMKLILSILKRSGMSENEFKRIIDRPDSINFSVPKSFKQRTEQLYDMLHVIIEDGKIHNNEIALCKIMAMRLGFKDHLINSMINNLKDLIEKGVPKDIALSQMPQSEKEVVIIKNDIFTDELKSSENEKAIFLEIEHKYGKGLQGMEKLGRNYEDLLKYEKAIRDIDSITMNGLYEFIYQYIMTHQITTAIRKENQPNFEGFPSATLLLAEFKSNENNHIKLINKYIQYQKVDDIDSVIEMSENILNHHAASSVLLVTKYIFDYFLSSLAEQNLNKLNSIKDKTPQFNSLPISYEEILFITVKIFSVLKQSNHMHEFPFIFPFFIQKWIKNKISSKKLVLITEYIIKSFYEI